MGFDVAIDEINEAGGVLGKKLRVIAYDDQGEPARAVDNARRIGEKDNCIIMIGGARTPNALAIRPVLTEIGLPWMGVISAGTRVVEWETGTNESIRTSMKDRWVAPFLIEYALKRSKTGKIGLMYEATGWGQGAVPDVEAAAKVRKVQLVGKETFNLADQDMSAQLIRLRDAGADTLVFYSVDREGNAILRSMDRLGYKPAIVSAWGLTGQLGQTAGPLADGVLVAGTFAWTGDLSPRAQKVWERIKAKFNLKHPGELLLPSATANSYDAVYIIAEALKTASRTTGGSSATPSSRCATRASSPSTIPPWSWSAQRHDAIVPSHYKMLTYHKGVMMTLDQTPFAIKK